MIRLVVAARAGAGLVWYLLLLSLATTTTAGAPTTAGCSSGFGEMGPGLLIKFFNEYLHIFFLF